jgi:hypothetical protein
MVLYPNFLKILTFNLFCIIQIYLRPFYFILFYVILFKDVLNYLGLFNFSLK